MLHPTTITTTGSTEIVQTEITGQATLGTEMTAVETTEGEKIATKDLVQGITVIITGEGVEVLTMVIVQSEVSADATQPCLGSIKLTSRLLPRRLSSR